MSTFHKNAHYTDKGYYAYDTLETLSAGDVLVGFLLSGHSSSRMFRVAHERARGRYKLQKSIDKMLTGGLIRTRPYTKDVLEITPHGREILELTRRKKKYALRQKVTQRTWDKKWRIITFDIPEKKRSARDATRYLLSKFDWFQIQKNIWVYPYACDDFYALLCEDPIAKQRTLFATCSTLHGDTFAALKFFNLLPQQHT
jgi:hypothetical protein